MSTIKALVGSTLIAGLLAGCGGADTQAETAPATRANGSADNVAITAKGLNEFFGFVHYRYTEFEQTEDLADQEPTDAGLTGEVVSYREGPSYFDDAGSNSGATVLMTVAIEDTFEGDTPQEQMVDVILPSGDRTPADFATALPAGSSLVLYLGAAEDLPPEEAAGLMSPVSPQGFVVAESDGMGVVFPLAGKSKPRQTAEDQIPS